MPAKARRPTVPKFETEAEEAQWWDGQKKMVEEQLVQAMRDGSAKRGTAQRLTRQAREARNITIRMPLDDLERARSLAEQKGLGYQTYMKMLLREALDREERKTRGSG